MYTNQRQFPNPSFEKEIIDHERTRSYQLFLLLLVAFVFFLYSFVTSCLPSIYNYFHNILISKKVLEDLQNNSKVKNDFEESISREIKNKKILDRKKRTISKRLYPMEKETFNYTKPESQENKELRERRNLIMEQDLEYDKLLEEERRKREKIDQDNKRMNYLKQKFSTKSETGITIHFKLKKPNIVDQHKIIKKVWTFSAKDKIQDLFDYIESLNLKPLGTKIQLFVPPNIYFSNKTEKNSNLINKSMEENKILSNTVIYVTFEED